MSKINLTEATMLALQGKLQLNESVEVEVNDGLTVVKTDDQSVVIGDNDSIELDVGEPQEMDEETTDTSSDVVEVPAQSEETIIPEEEVPIENFDNEVVPDSSSNETTDEEPANLDDSDNLPVEESKEKCCEKGIKCKQCTNLKLESINAYTTMNNFDDLLQNSWSYGREKLLNIAKLGPKYTSLFFSILEEMYLGQTPSMVEVNDYIWTLEDADLADWFNMDQTELEDKLYESKECIKESEETETITAESTDDEILDYIVKNFNTITGVDINDIFNKDKSEGQPIFDETVIDNSSVGLTAFLDSLELEPKRLDDLLYKLDDKLALLNESCQSDKKCESKKVECDVDSFNTVLTKALKSENARIKGFKATRVLKSESKVIVDGKMLDCRGKVTESRIILNKITEGKLHQKYSLSVKGNKTLNESKQNSLYIVTETKDNKFSCKSMLRKNK